MPGNTNKRRKKRRGTQGGSIDSRRRSGARPRNRQEAMAQARAKGGKGSAKQRKQPVDRRMIAPTWRSAAIRGGFFAVLLFPVSLLFGQEVPAALILTVIAAVFYIPLGYYTDTFFYNRRVKKARQEQAAATTAKKPGA